MKAGLIGLVALVAAGCLKDGTGDCATRFVDADGDGVGGADTVYSCKGDGVDVGGDCDDADPEVTTGEPEICDGVDNDCDGLVDDQDDDIGEVSWYADGDGDGYGDPEQVEIGKCKQPEGTVAEGTDCDDGDAGVSPGAKEVCADGTDQDCDELDDCALSGEVDAGNAAAGSWSGGVVAAVGDVSGDGLEDAAIGDPDAGEVAVLAGGEDGPTVAAVLSGAGRFGSAVAGIDAGGDAVNELVIGAPEQGEDMQGAVVVVWDPMVGEEVGVVEGYYTNESIGQLLLSLASSGSSLLGVVTASTDRDDVIDGWFLTIFSAVPESGNVIDTKAASAQLGPFTVADDWPLAASPASLRGTDSVVVGASKDSLEQGAAYTWASTASSSDDPSNTFSGASKNDALGAAVAAGDHLLLLGAPGTSSGKGKIYLFEDPRSTEIDVTDATATATGTSGDALGGALALLDLNGDGLEDLAVGAPGAGQVLIFLGPLADSLEGTAYATLNGGADFGSALAAADLNHDGNDDLLVSDGADTWLFFGGP